MLEEPSAYQRRVIRDHYRNRRKILVQRLQELASDAFAAPAEKGRERAWRRIDDVLAELEVPASRREHLRQSRSPRALAALIGEILNPGRG